MKRPENDILLVMGAFVEVFLEGNIEEADREREKPYILLGSAVDLPVGVSIPVGDIEKVDIPVLGRLSRDAYYVKGAQKVSLHQSTVVVMDAEHYRAVFYPYDVLANTSLLSPDGDTLTKLLDTAYEAGMGYYPVDLNDYLRNDYRGFLTTGAVFSLLLGVGLVFTVIHIILSVSSIIDANMREYSTHLVYGGTFGMIFLRCLIVCAFIYMVPSLVFLYLLPVSVSGGEVNPALFLGMVSALACFGCTAALGKLYNRDIAVCFERAERIAYD